MRTSELNALRGRTGFLTLDGLRVPVRVLDCKEAYGHLRYLVTAVMPNDKSKPEDRTGIWVNASRVVLD